MSNQITPEAFFDSLSLAHKLDNFLDGFKREEIHLFSYFSSILFLYAKHPITDWKHRYLVVDGYPFSDELSEAIDRHITTGLFEEAGEFYKISGRGTDEYNKFKNFPTLFPREKYIEAACTTSILVPYSQALRALLNEPEIKKVSDLKNNDWLEQMSVYKKFQEISEAVGIEATDLILPAVTWINYLSAKENPKA